MPHIIQHNKTKTKQKQNKNKKTDEKTIITLRSILARLFD